MPLYESICPACQRVQEWYAHTASQADPSCCGQPMRRLISSFTTAFSGEITARYNYKTSEDPHLEGHWAWRVKSAKGPEPEKVWIDTWQKQKEFCREEGLINPSELNPNAKVKPDGKGWQTAGMRGQWV